MTKVAVIAHAGKTIGGGLEELRVVLERAGVNEPIWSEVPKSKYAPERVQRALDEGAELVFVWGGDGMVQRSIDKLAGSGVTLAIIPAGTANLFASSLDIPSDIEEAVHIGLEGRDRTLDVGKINGERFGVMAGAGLDARMIRDADGGLKDRFGRLAYIWTASKNIRQEPFKTRIEINDELWYKGSATLRPARQYRVAVRWHRGIRQRASRRRPPRGRRHERRRSRRVGPNGRPNGRRNDEQVAVRPGDEGDEDPRRARSQGGVRARWRRQGADEGAEGEDRARRDHGQGAGGSMSTAVKVPETWELTGDDAREALAATGRLRLLKDAVVRLRHADGTSHSRSLAFVTSLVLVQGLIVIVGFAEAVGSNGLSDVIVDTIRSAAPGPAGDVLTGAVQQANKVGAHDRYLVLVLGLLGTALTGTTAMGQLERGLNRIYGVERDRPFLEKYRLAFLLAISAGTVIAASFVLLAFGRQLGASGSGGVHAVWVVTRWPLAVLLLAVGLAVLFRWSPHRHQPGRAWLAFGSLVAVVGWSLATLALALFFRVSSSFGDTYGPLAGIVGLQIWTFLSALSIFFGAAVAAQLEAVRAGLPEGAREDRRLSAAVAGPVS